MKSIAIVTDGYTDLDKFLKKNLQMIYENKIIINKYFINELKESQARVDSNSKINSKSIIVEDVVLVMLDDRIKEVSKYVKNKNNILVISRSISHSQVYRLFSIPKDTEVLVVNDSYETTMQTIDMLNNIGINHLKLIAFINKLDNNKNEIYFNKYNSFSSKSKKYEVEYSNISVAVTPGEPNLVPGHIENTIDLGFRYIDIMTIYEISSRLDLLDIDIFRNILKYDEKIVTLELGVRDDYKKLFVENSEYSSIIELSENGMIFVSDNEDIRFINNNAKKIFGVKKDVINTKVENLIDADLRKIINKFSCKHSDSNIGKSSTIKYKNQHLNVSAHKLTQFGKFIGTYYCVQDETYIRKLEQNLSKKLKSKGFIARYTFNDIYTKSEKMFKIIKLANKIADLDQTVLITGESGTGKEIMAQSIHNGSKYAKQPFIAVNCAAISENLLESELFGYEAGSFTGALKEGKAGLFEQAHNGTIFLDEIGDMNMYMQTKLLRVLQENQVMRVGSSEIIDIDIRVIAATNVDLASKMKDGKFRKDLYYRLNVLPIRLPSLREHKEDILDGLKYFMKTEKTFDENVISIFESYDWPGNMREVVNLAQYLDGICTEDIVTVDDLPYDLQNVDIENSRYEEEKMENVIEKTYAIEDKVVIHEIEELRVIRNMLYVLYDYSKIGIGCGRKKLVEELSKRNIIITENKVRKLLSIMKTDELIISDLGRSGSVISPKGIKFIMNDSK